MKKKHAILALVMIFSVTMNTACNDNETRKVPVAAEADAPVDAAVEAQSEEMKAVLEAQSNLDESIEALDRAEEALAAESELRADIQNVMGENHNILVFASDLKESNANYKGLETEVMLRTEAVADKRAIFNAAYANLSEEEMEAFTEAVENGEVPISETELDIAKYTMVYNGATESVDLLTSKIETLSSEIEAKQGEMDWALSKGAPRVEIEESFGAEISALMTQREDAMRDLSVIIGSQEIIAERIRIEQSR